MSNATRVVDEGKTGEVSVEDLDVFEEEIEGKPSYKVPEKFEGKSVEEIARSYEELEKHASQQSNEVGSLRRQNSQLLDLQSTSSQTPVETLETDALLDNPSKAINSAIDSNPTVRAIAQQLAKTELDSKRTDFEEKHPDWKEIKDSEGFKNFTESSPTRIKMWDAADRKFNYQVADELFTTYKEIHLNKSKQAATARKTKIAKSLDDASTISKGSGLDSDKKGKISRVYLQNLKAFDPQKYEMHRDQIMLAYSEGRVY